MAVSSAATSSSSFLGRCSRECCHILHAQHDNGRSQRSELRIQVEVEHEDEDEDEDEVEVEGVVMLLLLGSD